MSNNSDFLNNLFLGYTNTLDFKDSFGRFMYMYCIDYEQTGCGQKICCKECEKADCMERCNDSEECDSMTEKEPRELDERYEEVKISF